MNPSRVSWSEVSQRGARCAIHWSARFSSEAVSAWFTRRAGVKLTASSVVATDCRFILVLSSRLRCALPAQLVACGAQFELQGFAGNAFDVWPDHPAEPMGNRACERDGLNLQIKTAVLLLVAPV